MFLLYWRYILECISQTIAHLVNVVPLLFCNGSANIVCCHLRLVKQPLKNKQWCCNKQKLNEKSHYTSSLSSNKYEIIVLIKELVLKHVHKADTKENELDNMLAHQKFLFAAI